MRQADIAIARWMYDTCIPFNAVNSVYYQWMIGAIVVAGPSCCLSCYTGPFVKGSKERSSVVG